MFATHKHRRKYSLCPNCEHILQPADNFCPRCGQENHNLKILLGHLLYEFIESITHFDTKLAETSKAIFTKPGKITRDFLDGKRARYVPPARMYVFISFVFFLLLNTAFDRKVKDQPSFQLETRQQNGKAGYPSLTAEQKDSLARALAPGADSAQRQKLGTLLAAMDSVARPAANIVTEVTGDSSLQTRADLEKFAPMTDAELGRYLKSRKLPDNFLSRRLLRQSPRYAFDFNVKEFVHKVIKNLSVVMFILMPVVALLLLGLYYRKQHYYYEHLIFSVHFHSIAFIGYSLAILADLFSSQYSVLAVMNFLLIFYLYKSLRRVYGESRPKTLLKFFLLSSSYAVVALLCLVGVLFYSFLYF
jgi:hypothetical protein